MTADEHRMLALLAASDDGCTEAILLAHGLALELIDGIVSAGLATAQAERTFAAGRAIEFTRVRITEAGRRALDFAAPVWSNLPGPFFAPPPSPRQRLSQTRPMAARGLRRVRRRSRGGAHLSGSLS
jgi:hypothetical protein